MRSLTRVELAGPAGKLMGLLHRPEGEPRFVATVAHPHPLHGGTMDNKVVYRTARALEDAGGLVLRFNFRGTAGSGGIHDDGRGEQDDLRVAMDHVCGEGAGRLPLLLAGFSFGSVISARVGSLSQDVAGLLLVGAPIRSHAFAELRDASRPVAFVHGSLDEHGPVEMLRAMVEQLSGPHELIVVEGASHFFDDQQDELASAVVSCVSRGVIAKPLGLLS